jgi:hypothetical protein
MALQSQSVTDYGGRPKAKTKRILLQKNLSFVRTFVTKSLDVMLSLIPIPLARSLEWRIQKVQGKGIGSGSLRSEIQTVMYFLRKIRLENPVIFDVGAN